MHIKIIVRTSSKREVVEKNKAGTLVISVKEPARENKANRKVMQILRDLYRHKRVKIVSGHHYTHKIISIE